MKFDSRLTDNEHIYAMFGWAVGMVLYGWFTTENLNQTIQYALIYSPVLATFIFFVKNNLKDTYFS